MQTWHLKHWIVYVQPFFKGSWLLLTDEQPESGNKVILYFQNVFGEPQLFIFPLQCPVKQLQQPLVPDSLGHVRNSAGLFFSGLRSDHPSNEFQQFHWCCGAALRDRLQIPVPHWVQDLRSWIGSLSPCQKWPSLGLVECTLQTYGSDFKSVKINLNFYDAWKFILLLELKWPSSGDVLTNRQDKEK